MSPCENEGGFPLGVGLDMPYAASSVTLKPGSILLLYTDGIMEAFDEQDREFGLRRLEMVLENNGFEGPARVREAILAALDEHCGPVELTDDITLVVLQACTVLGTGEDEAKA